MLPKKTLLAVAAIGVIAMMLLPSSVMAANPSNPYDVFEPQREDENIGFERHGRAIYSNGTDMAKYRAYVQDCMRSFGIYLIVDIDWNDIRMYSTASFDLYIGYYTATPYYSIVKFNIRQHSSNPDMLMYRLECIDTYVIIEDNYGYIQTTERYERIYIAIESYETEQYVFTSMKYWTDTTSYDDPIGYVQIRRAQHQVKDTSDPYLCVWNDLRDVNGQYIKTTITQFDDPTNPPQWRKLQTVTAGYDTYDPWTMIQRVTTTIEQILPTWKEIQTVSNDIVSQLLKWLPLQNVFTSLQVQFPVWTMIQKIGHHLTVTSLMSQGLNFIILMIFILLPSLIAYAIVGRPGLIIGLMTTTILWTINEPKFLTSAFVIWTTCAVVLWRSIR